jgi:hypothetical protein
MAWQVHRFNDAVAVWVGTGQTVYMSVKQAEALAKALRTAAKSIKTERFVDSTCGTANGESLATYREFKNAGS